MMIGKTRTESDELAAAERTAKQIVTDLAEGVACMARARKLRDGTGVDWSTVDYESFLLLLPVTTVRNLLEYLPGLAEPWEVVAMKNREVTSVERRGYDGPIAKVRKRGDKWIAFVGSAIVEWEGDSVGWPTLEQAKAACDARLRESGVLLTDEVTP
jgi:hypothetical protein